MSAQGSMPGVHCVARANVNSWQVLLLQLPGFGIINLGAIRSVSWLEFSGAFEGRGRDSLFLQCLFGILKLLIK